MAARLIREVIDLTGEQLAACHVVQAKCKPPSGCWLNACRDAEEVKAAWDYAASPHDCSVAILTPAKLRADLPVRPGVAWGIWEWEGD